MSTARERRNWPARGNLSPRLALHAAQVTAKIDFSMMVLLDIIKKGMQGNEFHCRQVLPTSGHRSCSVWDVPDIKVSTVRRNCAQRERRRLCWIRVVAIVQLGQK